MTHLSRPETFMAASAMTSETDLDRSRFAKISVKFVLLEKRRWQRSQNSVKAIIDRSSNQFGSMDLAAFSFGKEVSLSRGQHNEDLRDFRRFARTAFFEVVE